MENDRCVMDWSTLPFEERSKFTVLYYPNMGFQVWCDHRTIYADTANANPVDMTDAMKRCSEGFVRCADCKIETQVVGYYFAGGYCKNCWLGETGVYAGQGGWKRKEANEMYN